MTWRAAIMCGCGCALLVWVISTGIIAGLYGRYAIYCIGGALPAMDGMAGMAGMAGTAGMAAMAAMAGVEGPVGMAWPHGLGLGSGLGFPAAWAVGPVSAAGAAWALGPAWTGQAGPALALLAQALVCIGLDLLVGGTACAWGGGMTVGCSSSGITVGWLPSVGLVGTSWASN